MIKRLFLLALCLAPVTAFPESPDGALELDVDPASLLAECCDEQPSAHAPVLSPVASVAESRAPWDEDLPLAFAEESGLLGFIEQCAEREVVPLNSLQTRDDREVMIGVNFDGVLGLYVFSD